MDKIRVAIVEDDIDWLKVLINFLNNEQDIIVVGSATNKEGAIKIAENIPMDVMLMDINLCGN